MPEQSEGAFSCIGYGRLARLLRRRPALAVLAEAEADICMYGREEERWREGEDEGRRGGEEERTRGREDEGREDRGEEDERMRVQEGQWVGG